MSRSAPRYALRSTRHRRQSQSEKINTHNNRREVGPLQAAAPGPVQTAAPNRTKDRSCAANRGEGLRREPGLISTARCLPGRLRDGDRGLKRRRPEGADRDRQGRVGHPSGGAQPPPAQAAEPRPAADVLQAACATDRSSRASSQRSSLTLVAKFASRRRGRRSALKSPRPAVRASHPATEAAGGM